jgi:hypothetical protein
MQLRYRSLLSALLNQGVLMRMRNQTSKKVEVETHLAINQPNRSLIQANLLSVLEQWRTNVKKYRKLHSSSGFKDLK